MNQDQVLSIGMETMKVASAIGAPLFDSVDPEVLEWTPNNHRVVLNSKQIDSLF